MKKRYAIKIPSLILVMLSLLNISKNVCFADEYKVPRRAIEIRPYVNILAAIDIYEDMIDNQLGFGGGLKVRNQIYGNFGYSLNVLINDLDIDADVNEGDSDLFSIFSGGFYYNYKVDYGYYVFDLCYGAMAVGSSSMTIFVPSVEFRRKLTNRIFYLFEIQYPIANDWIVDLDFEENYTSFSLSSGIAFIF